MTSSPRERYSEEKSIFAGRTSSGLVTCNNNNIRIRRWSRCVCTAIEPSPFKVPTVYTVLLYTHIIKNQTLIVRDKHTRYVCVFVQFRVGN